MAAHLQHEGSPGACCGFNCFARCRAGDLAAELELDAQSSSRLPPLPAVVAVFPDHALNDRLAKGTAEATQLASDWSVQTLR